MRNNMILAAAVSLLQGVVAISAQAASSFTLFSNPEEAASALVRAVEAADTVTLKAVLGPGSEQLLQ